MTIAVYPGTFDPITNGHLDIAVRAAKLFEKLVIGVYATPVGKNPLFSTEERVLLAQQAVRGYPNIEVQPFCGLMIDFAKKNRAQAVVRGLRMGGDFEYEFNMAMMNKQMYPDLELVCLMASVDYQFVSSSLLKEAASLGGVIDGLVPVEVSSALKEKFKQEIRGQHSK